VTQYTRHTKIMKGAGAGTKLTKITWSNTAAAPDVDDYRPSKSGQIIFNSAQTGVMKVSHTTDDVAVVTQIDTLPAAGYVAYAEVGAAAPWTANVAVTLKSDSGAAMTGVSVGDVLTEAATPTTGQYDVDAGGLYTFAAADVNDVVTVHYVADYQFVDMIPPEGGEFRRDLGVRTAGGIGLTRVALTSPLALEYNQYAVSENGAYYFDDSNGGNVLRINYQYEVADIGQTIVVKNDPIGYAPTLQIDIAYELDGQMMTVSFERAKPMGAGAPTKQEDFSGMKFEMKGFVNRETGVVYTISTSA